MSRFSTFTAFAKYSLFVLGYNIVVILWGVFLRASKSGDGCGQHWLTCHGEVIPSAPELKTVIEFSHRITSGLAFLFVLALVIWAFRAFEKGSSVRKTAVVSFIFIISEALLGAGLVLTGNTAETLTQARPFWMAGHLINTFVLVAFLTLTSWFATGGEKLRIGENRRLGWFLLAGAVGIFAIGITGSIAALSNMLFPSESLASGIAEDFSQSSHIIVRLRVLHPISSVVIGVFLFVLAGWIKKEADDSASAGFWSGVVSLLVLVQFLFGGLTLLTGAPILMQLGHLLLADALWISYVLLAASALSTAPALVEGSSTAGAAAS
ncbi:MAG: heme A synthase [Acidobacteria bacterium]|nr:MAG: heme A synthase [Acidobacteriota bacterium]REK02898.1 MAG: heme A synthase [Acidobacteriota bacterium]REK13298.1 MAG: heme A synthase [Acidobacteriota bacterium]REK41292.1 MAG: heme A synthase [Acidobacteriota bacterium]